VTKGEVSREARGSGHSTENSEEPDQKKLFTDFQRLTTTQSSDIVLISRHFLFTLTLTFFTTPSASTTWRQTSFCQDFSLYMEGPHSDSLGRSLAPFSQTRPKPVEPKPPAGP